MKRIINLILNMRRKESEYFLINLVILMFIFRGTIPVMKYPFILLFFFSIIYIILNYRSNLKTSMKSWIKSYSLLIVLFLFLLFSFVLSNKLYLVVFKELINIIVLFSFSIILFIIVSDKRDLERYLKSLINLIIIFSVIISCSQLFDLLNFVNNENYSGQPLYYIESGVISIDYNFALVPVFFGIFALIYNSINSVNNSFFIYNLILTINSLCIFFSGSRRGMILLILILVTFCTFNMLSLVNKKNLVMKIHLATRYYILFFSLFLISGYYITFNTSFEFKNQILRFLGSNDLIATRGKIAFSLSRYHSVLNSTKSYNDTYDLIWTPVFNPLDPDSGWGSKIHKTVFPLTGKNVEILPPNAKGYYLDHTTNCDTINKQAFSATFLSTFNVSSNEVLSASVYCFISEDCDISSAMVCSLGSMGNPGSSYDLSRKGTWQKLSFNIDCNDGTASVLLFISKYGVPNFSSLIGHIIFAYPQFEITDKNEFPKHEEACLQYFLRDDQMNLRKQGVGKGHDEIYSASVFNVKILATINPNVDPDLVRRWTAVMISEDTTYLACKSDFSNFELKNNVIHGRLDRWKFAFNIFFNEYSFVQKVIGGGFRFLNWYGYYFYSDKTKSDWPHNPLLSTILYSGLLGLVVYVYALCKAFIYYVKFSKDIPVILAFFIIAFFFSFFSASSPFDPPVLGFFFMLPFLIEKINVNSIK